MACQWNAILMAFRWWAESDLCCMLAGKRLGSNYDIFWKNNEKSDKCYDRLNHVLQSRFEIENECLVKYQKSREDGKPDAKITRERRDEHTLIMVSEVKPALSGNSKIDKTKVLKTNGSLMKVDRIAKCSLGIMQYFRPAWSDNWSWNPIFGIFESGCFIQVLPCLATQNLFNCL